MDPGRCRQIHTCTRTRTHACAHTHSPTQHTRDAHSCTQYTTHTYTHTHARAHARTHTHTYAHAHAHTHTHTNTHERTQTRAHTHTHTHNIHIGHLPAGRSTGDWYRYKERQCTLLVENNLEAAVQASHQFVGLLSVRPLSLTLTIAQIHSHLPIGCQDSLTQPSAHSHTHAYRYPHLRS